MQVTLSQDGPPAVDREVKKESTKRRRNRHIPCNLLSSVQVLLILCREKLRFR